MSGEQDMLHCKNVCFFLIFGLAMWVIKMFLFVDFLLIIEFVVCLQVALLNIVLSLNLQV